MRHFARDWDSTNLKSFNQFNQLEKLNMGNTFPLWLVPFGMMAVPFIYALLELARTPRVQQHSATMDESTAA